MAIDGKNPASVEVGKFSTLRFRVHTSELGGFLLFLGGLGQLIESPCLLDIWGVLLL